MEFFRKFGLKAGLLLGLLASGLGPAAAGDVSPKEAARLLETPGVVALDVRTPAEFKAGHIRGAVNVDYRAADFARKVSRLDPQVRYVLHCRSGRRSTGALPILEAAGIGKIEHMTTGIIGWRAAGLPLVTE
jgi:rhodanese-related sulfurtransferase